MKFGLNLALRRFQKEQRIWNLKRIQELPRRLFRPEKGAGKTALECSSPNVYRGEKSQILPRFSALVLFESSAFRNGAIYLTSKTNSGRRRWFSYMPSQNLGYFSRPASEKMGWRFRTTKNGLGECVESLITQWRIARFCWKFLGWCITDTRRLWSC